MLYLVGGGQILKLCFGIRIIFVLVGMQIFGQCSVCAFDLVINEGQEDCFRSYLKRV